MVISSAFNLPFEVRYSSSLLSSCGTVDVITKVKSVKKIEILLSVFDLFAEVAMTGALAGQEIKPWNSGLQINPEYNGVRFKLTECRVDECALVVLSHLLLARQDAILLESLEMSSVEKQASLKLRCDSKVMSTYPGIYHNLPFPLTDDEPESGAYTFVAEMKKPLQAAHEKSLKKMLKRWTGAVLAGGYALAPIPPQESYVELAEESITSFNKTFELTIFKLQADPASLFGIVNIFAAFHKRCQEIISLRIT